MTGLKGLGVAVSTVIRKFLKFIDPKSFLVSLTHSHPLSGHTNVSKAFLWGLLLILSESSDPEMEKVLNVKVSDSRVEVWNLQPVQKGTGKMWEPPDRSSSTS